MDERINTIIKKASKYKHSLERISKDGLCRDLRCETCAYSDHNSHYSYFDAGVRYGGAYYNCTGVARIMADILRQSETIIKIENSDIYFSDLFKKLSICILEEIKRRNSFDKYEMEV